MFLKVMILYVCVSICVYYNSTTALDFKSSGLTKKDKSIKVAALLALSLVGIASVAKYTMTYLVGSPSKLSELSMLAVIFITILNIAFTRYMKLREQSGTV